jgi:type I restriction enzyme S subunit
VNARERIRFKFTSDLPLKYGANAAAEFDNPDWPRFVRITDVTPHGDLREDTFRSLPPEVAKGYELENGDILLARSGATVGKTFIYDPSWGEACYAGYLIRSRTSDAYCSKYIYWYLQSAEYWGEIRSNLIQATIQNFSAEKYANIEIPALPLERQKRIAAFLDEKTTQIDALIAKKQALLERLAEKRQAIITQAVTKGLNAGATMKDSGVEWLGQVPAHWELKPLKRVVFYQEGPGIMAADFRDEGVPLLRVASVGRRWATLEGANFLHPEMVARKWEHFRTRAGDLLISASATSGIVSEVDGQTVGCVPYTGILRLNSIPGKSVVSFIRHYVVSTPFIAQIDQLKAGSTIQHYGPYHLGLMSLAVPPIDEQSEIATFLDDLLARCREVEDRIGTSIARLTEYRAALITAAVTGQIEGLR